MLKTALMCLALTVYHESRGEPLVGQFAVAEVVMNRVEQRDKTVCQVVKESRQFSWVRRWDKKIPDNKEWEQAVKIAELTLKGVDHDYVGSRVYFKKYVKPTKVKNSIRIGKHVFHAGD